MLTKEVAKLPPVERFHYWIRERQSIRLKRLAGKPKPWTDDDILQSYRFCNVRRMDDKVSVWLLENWYKPNFNHPMMVPAVALARHFNKPETLESLGFPRVWNPKRLKSVARELKARGQPIFNGAYIVRGNDGDDKVECVIDHTIQPLIDTPIAVNRDSMAETWNELRQRYGFGSFMAGQVVADLRWALKGTWADADLWACRGPGSVRGVNRYHSRPIGAKLSQERFLDELLRLIEVAIEELPEIAVNLEAHDFQNCLCEFDKYERTLFDARRPKQLYSGKV